MKIFVRPRAWILNHLESDSEWHYNKWVISIYSTDSQSPFLPRYNVLSLQFDDVTEKDKDGIHFTVEMAKEIVNFISDIKNDNKIFYVHCDAGVSRSGAVGYLLNEWFNKFINNNIEDNEFFLNQNSHIMPNPEVVRILKNEMFGVPFMNIEVNDYEYNEDGEKIDHFSKI